MSQYKHKLSTTYYASFWSALLGLYAINRCNSMIRLSMLHVFHTLQDSSAAATGQEYHTSTSIQQCRVSKVSVGMWSPMSDAISIPPFPPFSLSSSPSYCVPPSPFLSPPSSLPPLLSTQTLYISDRSASEPSPVRHGHLSLTLR